MFRYKPLKLCPFYLPVLLVLQQYFPSIFNELKVEVEEDRSLRMAGNRIKQKKWEHVVAKGKSFKLNHIRAIQKVKVKKFNVTITGSCKFI